LKILFWKTFSFAMIFIWFFKIFDIGNEKRTLDIQTTSLADCP